MGISPTRMANLFDVEQKRMLKHVCTRWLSIGRCLTHLLHNWIALKAFFKAEKEMHDKRTKKSDDATERPYAAITVDDATERPYAARTVDDATERPYAARTVDDATERPYAARTVDDATERPYAARTVDDATERPYAARTVDDATERPYAACTVDSIHTFLKSPTNKLYVLFLEYTVKVFDDVLVNLQSDEPKIHVLLQSLLKVLRNLLVRFVKPAAIRGESLEDVNFTSAYNHKNDSELVSGDAARAFIAEQRAA